MKFSRTLFFVVACIIALVSVSAAPEPKWKVFKKIEKVGRNIRNGLIKAGPAVAVLGQAKALGKLDDFQPPEQAGFRKGYSTIDHIHTLRQIIQKTEEYNRPLCLAFVDYEKAFDSIEIWAVLQSLQRCQSDNRYIEVLKSLYRNATMSVRVQDRSTKPIQLQRGVRQGDVMSPKLFTAALEDVFKLLDWTGFDININGEYITYLRYADDIVVMAESLEDLGTMLDDLSSVSRLV